MKDFFKVIGAFLYSLVQAILIDLFFIALMFCFGKLLFWLIPHILSWGIFIFIPILLLIVLLWWAISFFTTITSIPYGKLKGTDNSILFLILPIITLILNAIIFCYREWTFTGIDAPKSYVITYNVIATILIVIITLFSIVGMLSDE